MRTDHRPAVLARVASALIVGAGLLTFASIAVAPSQVQVSGLAAVGLGAVALGAVAWALPWSSWSPRTSLWLVVPAFALIVVGTVFGPSEPYDYGVFLVVLHVWVGLAHPAGTSLALTPVTAVAYAIPLLVEGVDPAAGLASGVVVVPLCAAIGEAVAWSMRALDVSEGNRVELERIVERAKHAESQLQFLAYHDAVTGLPNRMLLHEHLHLTMANASRRRERVAVCALDLDRFKLVNDTLGHAAGDDFLREVATRLRSALRAGDLVGRVGGDEFLVVMPLSDEGGDGAAPVDGTATGATPVAEVLRRRLLDALEAPYLVSGMEVRMSASTGVATYPDEADDAESLLRRADAAMYRDKRRRSDSVAVVDATDDADAESLAEALERAASARRWSLVYQPITELVLGRTVGAESLIRWSDARLANVGPDRFIPVAEELGLIAEIGDWVTDELVRQCRRWRAEGVLDQLRFLTFNLSPRELWHPALVDRLATFVDVFDRRDLLVAEITESALTMDPGRAVEMLTELRACGVRVALDDFGSGYSSLARLRDLPIDLVKIDRDFLRNIEGDGVARSIVRAVMRLCHSLEMVPVAEGVERASQLDFLTEAGCMLAQGHLFAPAGPASRLSERLRVQGRDPVA